MSISYVPVSEGEQDEPIELPTEEDGTLALSTVAAQFVGASGLKYRADCGRLRGLRLLDDCLQPPPGGWTSAPSYWCAFPRDAPPPTSPTTSPGSGAAQRCSDLIVLGLPWKTGEEAVREYFGSFGELVMVQVKRDPKTGLSKGFGFVKFGEYGAQTRALGRRHLIDGRWCDVRVPHGKDGGAALDQSHRKVFVGRCTEALTAEDLREHFAHYGQVTDVFVPRPFRAFSFVTFLEADVAQSLCGQDHIIKGVSVNVSTATPKGDRGAGPEMARGSLVGWGLVDGSRVYNWTGDVWPAANTHPHPEVTHKPYLKYE